MDLFDLAQGQPVSVPTEQAAALVSSGSHAFVEGQQVPVVSPDGQVGMVPAEKAYDALKGGFQLASDAQLTQARYGDQEVRAGLEGFGRGALPFGATDAAQVALGTATPADLKGRAEASPVAAGVGEGAGLAAGLLTGSGEVKGAELGLEGANALAHGAEEGSVLSRALSAPGRLAGAAGDAAQGLAEGAGAGRFAQMAVRGGTEGALYGAGQALDESVLDDKPLTAQMLWHDVGEGLLFGAGGGAVTDAALGLAARKLPEALDAASSKLSKLAEHLAPSEEDAAQGARGFVKSVEGAHQEVGAALRDFTESAKPARIEQLIGDAPASEGARVALAQAAEDLPARSGAAKVVAEVDKQLAGADSLAKQHGALDALLRAPELEGPKLAPLRARVQAALEDPQLFGKAADYQVQVRKALDPLQQAQANLEGRLFSKEASGELRAHPGKLESMLEAEAKGGIGSDLERQALETWQQKAQGALKALDETTYEPLGSKAVDAAKVQRQVESISEGRAGAAKSRLAEAQESGHSGVLFSGIHALAEAAGLHGLHGLGGLLHIAPAAISLGRTGKSATVAKLIRRSVEASTKISSAIRSALSETGGKAASAAVAGRKPFESRGQTLARRASLVASLSSQPELHSARMTERMPTLLDHAPETAAAMIGTSSRAAAYLSAHAPRDPRPPSPFPGQRPWKPSPSQQSQFQRVERAVMRPLSLLDNLRAGRLTPDEVDAMRTVHPDLYSRVLKETQELVASHKEPLSSARQAQISVLAGQPLDAGTRLLGQWQGQPATSNPQPPPQGGKPGAIKGLASEVSLGRGPKEST